MTNYEFPQCPKHPGEQMLACSKCDAEFESVRPARGPDDLARGGCKHASTRPPADAGCPWCRIESLEWELVGEKAKFAGSLQKIETLEYRIFALINRSGPQ
jgi:hypothetical protein